MYIVAVFYNEDEETLLCAYETMKVAREALRKALTKAERKWEEVVEENRVIYKDTTVFSSDSTRIVIHAMIVPLVKYTTHAELVREMEISEQE